MNNQKLADFIFKSISNKIGREIYDIVWLEGCSYDIVHFRIKGLKWLFGIWFYDDKIYFFTQHLHNIDKFKPQASFFSVSLNDDNNFIMNDIIRITQQIIANPIPSYCMDLCESNLVTVNYLRCFLVHEFRYYFDRVKTWWSDFVPLVIHKPKTWFLRFLPFIRKCEWVDNNGSNFRVDPRYTLRICIKDIYFGDYEKIEGCIYKFFFRKKQYSNFEVLIRNE